ncbi:MAG: C39 family peptidase [Coriobacteriia bacterium]|nr:C39 family peptidase [Coriobacteriia bacterium]
MKGYRRLLAAGLALAFALTPATAHAAGTGDSPRHTKDVPTEATLEAAEDYERWLAEEAESIPATDTVGAAAIIGPYKYFYTPTHPQERSYWCGPATVQTLDDYWGTPASQSAIALFLGTTTNGTDFLRVDDALRFFTGVNYVVSPKCATYSDVLWQIQYGLSIRCHPAAADVRILGYVWNNYVYSHSGHIIPIEAFDWRYMTVRINDPYDESRWQSGGGNTLGHKTYPASQIQSGVMNHWQKVLIY